MNLNGRLSRIEKQTGRDGPGPLTVVLHDDPDFRQREHVRSDGSRVVEMAGRADVFGEESSQGPVAELPRGPFKLAAGFDPIDMV